MGHDLAGHPVRVVARLHVGGDRDAPDAIVALDLRDRPLEPKVRHLRERRQAAVHRGDVHPLQVRRRRAAPLRAREAHHDRPRFTIRLAQRPRLETGQTESHGPVDLDRLDAEQAGLGAVDRHAEIGASQADRIRDVLSAGRRLEQALDLRRDHFQRVERGSLDPHRDRRVHRRPVLELAQRDFGARIRRKVGPQRIEQTQRLARLVTVQQHEELADPRVVGP